MSGIEEGTVKCFYNVPDRMYGFIEARDGTEIFFHDNNCVDRHAERLARRGDDVWFERTMGAKGPKATRWGFDPYDSYPDLCHSRLGTTSQVGAYYVGGSGDGYPDLSEGCQFKGSRAMYHSLKIHRDDVETFVARVKKWEKARTHYRVNLLVYANEAERTYFFSSKWEQPELPEGYKPTVYRLPIAVKPRGDLYDGIITRKDEVQRMYLGGMREIPNPNPEYQAKRYDDMPITANVAPDGGTRS